MKSDYKDIEFVKNGFRWCYAEGHPPINTAEVVLSDLVELKLTTEVLQCETMEDLHSTLHKAQHIILNNQLEYYKQTWEKIQEITKISGTTIFNQVFLQKLNEIPKEYALRSKVAELVFRML